MAHQVGAFAGVWMGGRVYDLYGSYTLTWWAAVRSTPGARRAIIA